MRPFANNTGLSRQHPVYRAWRSMRKRCTDSEDQSYHLYGGVGISYSAEGHSFDTFYKDMFPTWKPGLTLDRENNNDDYCKDNCRWATVKQQARNRSTTRLYEGDVDRIRDLYTAGHSIREIAIYLNQNYQNVYDVAKGRSWL